MCPFPGRYRACLQRNPVRHITVLIHEISHTAIFTGMDLQSGAGSAVAVIIRACSIAPIGQNFITAIVGRIDPMGNRSLGSRKTKSVADILIAPVELQRAAGFSDIPPLRPVAWRTAAQGAVISVPARIVGGRTGQLVELPLPDRRVALRRIAGNAIVLGLAGDGRAVVIPVGIASHDRRLALVIEGADLVLG